MVRMLVALSVLAGSACVTTASAAQDDELVSKAEFACRGVETEKCNRVRRIADRHWAARTAAATRPPPSDNGASQAVHDAFARPAPSANKRVCREEYGNLVCEDRR